MKKILLLLSVSAIVLCFSVSCKRCVTCSYTYTVEGTTVDTTVKVAQTCGSKQDRIDYENTVKGDAALVGGVVTCEN